MQEKLVTLTGTYVRDSAPDDGSSAGAILFFFDTGNAWFPKGSIYRIERISTAAHPADAYSAVLWDDPSPKTPLLPGDRVEIDVPESLAFKEGVIR